jgi:ribosomal protein S18 acetylase RimI-like enzyme
VTRFVSEMRGAHDRTAFESGHPRIDSYFRLTVSQDVKRGYAVCYVLVEQASGKVAGFYTLSSDGIPLTELAPEAARKLPRYPSVPAVMIGWLGRDLAYRGQSLGSLLLYDAIARLATSPIGAYALCADAIDDAAAAFYVAHQFQPFQSRPHCFFLPMKTASSLLPP